MSLPELAAETVSKVMKRGAATHEPDEWKTLSIWTHLEHAAAHVKDAIWDVDPAGMLEDLENAVCRSVMALQVFLDSQQQEGDIDEAIQKSRKDGDSLAAAQHIRVANGVFKTTLRDLPKVVGKQGGDKR